ncbi:hypothetical protein KA005_59790, partial [bacterium]|nr:hypothetical protein [bacterium]
MARLIATMLLSFIILFLSFSTYGFAANRLAYENFDDEQIDSGFTVYGSNWAKLSPPQYNLNSVSRNGAGYCFSSGTSPMAYLCWESNIPYPWPSDEMYVSFWMRYPTFTSTDSHENIKFFYPHWNGTQSYVHYVMSSRDTVYYSAKGNGAMLSQSNWLGCPNQTDGNWHHYEFYVKFSTGISRFWYDGVLKVDHIYGEGNWTPNKIYYISAPSIDAEEPGVFSRQVDDWEVWDGMPSEQEDNEIPYTSGHNPAKNAINVARNTNIVVHVLDSGDGVDEPFIEMTVEGVGVSPTITGTAANYTLTYDPPSDFSPGQVVNVTIDAEDLHSPANVMATDTYSFTIQSEPDTVDPTITITQPASEDTYSTAQNTITLSGTSSDNVGITSVTWVNDRGGSGTASGTDSWTISNISLQEGDNVITVTAHDAAGNSGVDTLTVTYSPPSGTYTKEFGGGTGTDYPGTLQDTFININEGTSYTHEYLNTYTWPQDKPANSIIMKWDLSAIPSSATIQDATLYLYLSSAGGDDLYDLSVHKIINYNPVISACTGYTYNGTN